ncbi:DUF6339 family protein [Luteolibacter marinus]|uniref:DUF6339 family protein n=1 Tax=Luteolibacter marinus TaxID=2776705 RepID=UPI0018663F91|nr:DUF6339 family protein [Luteolibacter marinus]
MSEASEEPLSVARIPQDLLNRGEHLSFASSGGTVNRESAFRIAASLRNIASQYGFPSESDTQQRGAFDRDASIALAQMEELLSGEALRDDVWACLTTVMAPDVVAWRFPSPSPERFHGGVRNAFQRLWVRGVTLDRGEGNERRWELLGCLKEDAMVQIFERPAIAANAPLARAIAEAWLLVKGRFSKGLRELIFRTAIKMIRLRNEIVDLSALEEDGLQCEVLRVFGNAEEWVEKEL